MKIRTNLKSIWITQAIALVIFLGVVYKCTAQAEKYNPEASISISIYQDAKFLVAGDNRGNNAGTLDVLFRFKMQGIQQKYGYMIVFPEYEYANLSGGKYVRYSANVGYVFNLIKKIEFNISVGYGWIDRSGTTSSGSLSSELAYKISKRFKLSILSQYTERGDINLWRYSLMGGIEIKI